MSEDRNLTPEGAEDQTLETEDWETDAEPEPAADGADVADGEPDAGADELDGESEPAAASPPAQPPRGRVKPSASERFQTLANENRNLRQRLDAIERAQTQPRQPSADDLRQQEQAQEAQFLQQISQQMLEPHQQAAAISRFYNERSERRMAQAIEATRYTTWDATDRANYEREISANPTWQRYADRVEELRRQAPGVSRLDLLDKAIGEALRRNVGSARTRQQNRAAAQAAANGGTRVPASASNVPNPRSTGRRQGFEHLRNVQI